MRKTPRGWIQIGESRTRGVARIPLGLKPSRDSRATSQRDSPIWIQPLGVFRYRRHMNNFSNWTCICPADDRHLATDKCSNRAYDPCRWSDPFSLYIEYCCILHNLHEIRQIGYIKTRENIAQYRSHAWHWASGPGGWNGFKSTYHHSVEMPVSCIQAINRRRAAMMTPDRVYLLD